MVKVFISWSGERSKALAEELRDWLPTIVQSLELFVSTQDVPVGGRGLNVLASQLQDCSFGILCLTQENKEGPWIHFEAGALSKVIEASRVVPLLLDLKVSDLTGPLVQFQAISITDRDGVFSLIKALAEQSTPPIAEGRLKRLFDAFWPELEAKVSQLKDAAGNGPRQEIRSEREILEEILLLSRNTERQMASAATVRTAKDVLPARSSQGKAPSPSRSSFSSASPDEVVARELGPALYRIGVTVGRYYVDDQGIHYTILATHPEEIDRDEAIAKIIDHIDEHGLAISIKGGPFKKEEFFDAPAPHRSSS